jgi:hypothetical protein
MRVSLSLAVGVGRRGGRRRRRQRSASKRSTSKYCQQHITLYIAVLK